MGYRFSNRSERDVVDVHLGAGSGRAGCGAARAHCRRSILRGRLAEPSLLAGAPLEVDDASEAQLEARPLLAVVALVLARPELALGVGLVALAELFGGALSCLVPDLDPQPERLLDPLPVRSATVAVDRDPQVRDRLAARRVAQFGVRAEVADDHHLVERH